LVINLWYFAVRGNKVRSYGLWNQVGLARLAFPHNKGGRTNTAFSKQHSALFGRCERSEHKRPVRTVTVVAVALTATENPKGRMRVVRFIPCHFERRNVVRHCVPSVRREIFARSATAGKRWRAYSHVLLRLKPQE
jgi:hypothetical protein